MSLSEHLEREYLSAYKAKDQLRVAVLRMLKTAIKNKQVELLRPLADEEVLDVIARQLKQRRESIEQFNAAGRPDLAEKESAEAVILADYMPAQITPEELAKAVDEAVERLGASGMKDMGRVMKSIMDAYKGRVDGKDVSDRVKARLSA